MALPNLVIAGAPKCGTSSMFRWIADHPDAEGATVKEARYFIDADSHVFDPSVNFATGGVSGYERFFPATNPRARVRLEATPVYLYQRSAMHALPDLPSRPKILFLLREPGRQILSTYRYFSNNWRYLKAGISFADFLEMVATEDRRLAANELLARAVENVRYVDRLTPWRERLDAGRMRVMLLEDIQADPTAAMTELAEWLGLDAEFYHDYAYPKENQTYRARSQTLQALNVRVRGLAAKTPLYKSLRWLYRGANTAAEPAPMTERDLAALADLSASFAEDNARLAEELALDLSRWSARG